MSAAELCDPVGALLEKNVREGWMPGAVWWIEGPHGVLSRGAVGHSALEPLREPAAESIPYDLASLTKALATAPLLLLAEQDGMLDMERPVATYLDLLSGSPVGASTPLSLACHSSGLPAWKPLYLEAGVREDYLRLIGRLPLTNVGRELYSDIGYIVLGALLEKITGSRLDILFEERIAVPLGLSRTGFATARRSFAEAAATERGNAYERQLVGAAGAAHEWRTEILRGEVHDGNAHGLGGVAGHAGLFGTSRDIALLANELLDSKILGLAGPARELLLSTPRGQQTRTVGMLTAAASAAARGALPDRATGHTGFTGTSFWLDRESHRIYILLTNRVHPAIKEIDFQSVRLEFHRIAAALPDR